MRNCARSVSALLAVLLFSQKDVRTKLSRFASTAIGTGVGLGIGLGLGAIADSKDKYGGDPNLGKLAFGFTGVLLGSLFGGAFGFGSKRVYEAP